MCVYTAVVKEGFCFRVTNLSCCNYGLDGGFLPAVSRSTPPDDSSSSPNFLFFFFSESVHDVIENVVETKAYKKGKYTDQIKESNGVINNLKPIIILVFYLYAMALVS